MPQTFEMEHPVAHNIVTDPLPMQPLTDSRSAGVDHVPDREGCWHVWLRRSHREAIVEEEFVSQSLHCDLCKCQRSSIEDASGSISLTTTRALKDAGAGYSHRMRALGLCVNIPRRGSVFECVLGDRRAASLTFANFDSSMLR